MDFSVRSPSIGMPTGAASEAPGPVHDDGSRSSPDLRPEVTFREGEPDSDSGMAALARLSSSSPLANTGGLMTPDALVGFIPDLTASRRKATIEALRRNSLNPERSSMDAVDHHAMDGGSGGNSGAGCPPSENGDSSNGFGPASRNPHLAGMPLLLGEGTSLAALESLTNGAQGLGGIALGLVDGRANSVNSGGGSIGDRRRSSPKQQEPVLDLSSKPLSKLNTTNPTDAAALAVTNLLQTIHNQVKPPTQVCAALSCVYL